MAGKRGQYTAYDGDQVAKWKAAEVANRRQQRSRRGKRLRQDASSRIAGPGMLRVVTVADGEKDGPDGGESQPPGGHPPAA